jgi:hypothetical protein
MKGVKATDIHDFASDVARIDVKDKDSKLRVCERVRTFLQGFKNQGELVKAASILGIRVEDYHDKKAIITMALENKFK